MKLQLLMMVKLDSLRNLMEQPLTFQKHEKVLINNLMVMKLILLQKRPHTDKPTKENVGQSSTQ